MLEKHLWKSDILSIDAGRWHVSLRKISLFHLQKWNIGRKWVTEANQTDTPPNTQDVTQTLSEVKLPY